MLGRFWAIFLLSLSVFAVIEISGAAALLIHKPLQQWLFGLATSILAVIVEVQTFGSYLYFRKLSVEITEACDGVLPIYIYVSAVLAFPSRWITKAWGLIFGVCAIMSINLLRIVTLILVGGWNPDFLEAFHLYFWQALVIASSMALWVLWAERWAGRDAAKRA